MSRLEPKEVAEFVSYDAETGTLTWRSGRRAGKTAGSVHKSTGYCTLRLPGGFYQAHRIAWALHYGEWPAISVDHINLDKTDNRIVNLRAADAQLNGANVRARRSGLKGATFHKGVGRWMAQIKVHERTIYLGLHDTEQQAHDAYAKAAVQHFCEYARVA